MPDGLQGFVLVLVSVGAIHPISQCWILTSYRQELLAMHLRSS